MITWPNLITLTRAPLALLFLQDNIAVRVIAVILSMIADWLDGFMARKFNMTSESGKFLDPIMDKFFAFFILTILVSEKNLMPWQMTAMLTRDFCIAIFGVFVACFGSWSKYECESIWISKLVTTCQFIIIIGLTVGISFNNYIYITFILLAFLSLLELLWHYSKKS